MSFQQPLAKQPTMLRIDHSEVTDEGLKVIANNEKLIRLKCNGSLLTDLSGPTIATLTNMQRLDVAGTRD